MSIAVGVALLSAVGTLYAAFQFSQYPDAAERYGHDPAFFRQVMAGRYGFMAAMLFGAAYSGQAGAVAFILICLALVGLWDWFTYSQSGLEAGSHLIVACLALLLGLIVLLLS